MRIITDTITLAELRVAASSIFGNLVKAVVDIEREVVALDAEMHADLESLLIENGSRQQDVWGINLYPEESPANFLEFDSMINVRPSQNNRSRNVEDPAIRATIERILAKRITR